jgi:hypothetical protein
LLAALASARSATDGAGVLRRRQTEPAPKVPVEMALIREPGRRRHVRRSPAPLEEPAGEHDALADLERMWCDAERFLEEPDESGRNLATTTIAPVDPTIPAPGRYHWAIWSGGDHSDMSFDLYVFDLGDVPDDEEAIGDLLEDDSRWGAPFTDRLAQFVAEMQRRYPGLDDHPNDSPWASWPLTDSMVEGRCCGLNIVWSAAERMSSEVAAACHRHGLTLYDPQAGVVHRPRDSGASPTRAKRWWRRT